MKHDESLKKDDMHEKRSDEEKNQSSKSQFIFLSIVIRVEARDLVVLPGAPMP